MFFKTSRWWIGSTACPSASINPLFRHFCSVELGSILTKRVSGQNSSIKVSPPMFVSIDAWNVVSDTLRTFFRNRFEVHIVFKLFRLAHLLADHLPCKLRWKPSSLTYEMQWWIKWGSSCAVDWRSQFVQSGQASTPCCRPFNVYATVDTDQEINRS